MIKFLTAVVILCLGMSQSWANAPKNPRFQQLKQEMWLTGLSFPVEKKLGEQPLSIEEITQNLPQIAEAPEKPYYPEELDYVLHKFGHKL